jgi:hypothetical protein
MKLRNIVTSALIMGAATLGVSAQNTYSGYFLDNYTYRYQLNPAFGGDKSFVSIPGMGNINLGIQGNLNLSSVLYDVNGRTCLFTNPNVSVAEVMSNIHDSNELGTEFKLNVLSGGFKAFGGYNTISINARASLGLAVPGSFFSLAKEGISNTTYDISGLKASAFGYGEVALGHSREIMPGLRVGGALKFLVGMANFDAYFNQANLTLGENEWIAQTDADVYANFGKFEFDHEVNDRTGKEYVSGANLDGDGSIGPNGFGVAFDLGAEYKWNDFNFSLALLDLGFINYSDTHYATTNGLQTINTDAYIFNPNGDASNSFDNEWDRLSDDLDKLYQLSDEGVIGSRTRTLHATMNIGAEYELPMYRNLTFGLLNTTCFAGEFTYNNTRLSANVRPVRFIGVSVNGAVGTYGAAFGWLLSFGTGGNFFIGMDRTIGKVTKQFVPLSSNCAVNFGFNVTF